AEGHSLSAVIAGLDPAIHEAAQQRWQYGFALGISSWMPPNSACPSSALLGRCKSGKPDLQGQAGA
ncbi:MAG: hypothetical protein WCB32_17395, partial [Pseudolabrys sp.]